jgi:hypothetical protein
MVKRLVRHARDTAGLFLHSFRSLDTNCLFTMLADMLQLVLVLLVVVPGFLVLLQTTMVPLVTEVMPTVMYMNSYSESEQAIPQLTPELEQKLESNVSAVKGFFIKSGLTVIGLVIVLLFISSICRGFVYSRLHKINFRRFIKRFTLHNVLWYLFWALLIIITFSIFKPLVAGYIIAVKLMLIIVLTPIYRSLHRENDSLSAIIKRFISKGILRFYRFLLPLLLIYLVFIASFYMLSLIMSIMPFRLSAFIIFIYASAFVAWSRHYIFISVKSHLKKEAE